MSKYTKETVAKICSALREGDPIILACKKSGISEDTFARWREKKPSPCPKKDVQPSKLFWNPKYKTRACAKSTGPAACQKTYFWQADRGQRSPKDKQTECVGVHRYGSHSVCAVSQNALRSKTFALRS